MDIEWAKDGITGELLVVPARPETVQSQKSKDILGTYLLEKRSEILVRGKSLGDKIASGKVHLIPDVSDLPPFNPGEILIAHNTTPDREPVMKTAAAIVTNKGGRTCPCCYCQPRIRNSRSLGEQAMQQRFLRQVGKSQ